MYVILLTSEINLHRYVPKPRPGVFRITKTNHNILQGVSGTDDRLDCESQQQLVDWTRDNANRYWLHCGGPLSSPADGGADVVVIDDPQMTGLIPIAKEVDPQRPVIYRSHIQMRSDLIATSGTPQADVWEFLWRHIQAADLFISHPVVEFVPKNVPTDRVGYMPASTDWLDGLNKEMREWDTAFYGRQFNHMCKDSEMPIIEYPAEQYIVQIARFDPAKGILDVLRSYEKFHDKLAMLHPDMKIPKLLICGHGSIDDPDGSIVYDAVLQHIAQAMPHLMALITVIRLSPSDQVLNTLLSKAHIVLQLSSREGFEVKVSEALHKGKPVIATRAGGIPLQVEHERNGYLVDVGDTEAVARHLLMLWTDRGLYERMSAYASENISDEVSTVGQALNWFFLASKLSQGEEILPRREWIQDLARSNFGQAYTKADGKLKRSLRDVELS
jgi:glycosyltransferase involved in cell wall biosynthesis